MSQIGLYALEPSTHTHKHMRRIWIEMMKKGIKREKNWIDFCHLARIGTTKKIVCQNKEALIQSELTGQLCAMSWRRGRHLRRNKQWISLLSPCFISPPVFYRLPRRRIILVSNGSASFLPDSQKCLLFLVVCYVRKVPMAFQLACIWCVINFRKLFSFARFFVVVVVIVGYFYCCCCALPI